MGLFLAAKPAVYVARHATAVAIGGGGRPEVSDVTAPPPGWVQPPAPSDGRHGSRGGLIREQSSNVLVMKSKVKI